MRVEIPLEQMTVTEKIQVMEQIWADLSKQSSQLPSPTWHRDVLQERKRLVDEKKLKFLDWDEAIAEFRETSQ